MRWKLLVIVSLLATVLGAGSTLCLVYFLTRSVEKMVPPSLLAPGALLLPIAAIACAGFFVYRHTARRRRLQAMLTALFTAILTFTALLLGSAFHKTTAPTQTPIPVERNIG